jgi:hypothetical protein
MDEQPSVSVEGETKLVDEHGETKLVDEHGEIILPTNEESYINIEDSTDIFPMNNQINDIPSFVYSLSSSPRNEEQASNQINHHSFQPIASQFSANQSLNSSTAALTPIEPQIRVEISEKTKPFIQVTRNLSQIRQELTPAPPPPPPPPSSQPYRFRKQPTQLSNRTSIKTTVSDQTTGKRYLDFYIFFFYNFL